MPKKPLDEQVRDHAEAIRNLERIGGETVSGIRALHQRLSKAQEYQLRDNRLTAEDIKDLYTGHEKRISALERFRIYVVGMCGGIVAWWKYHHFLR